MSMDASVSRSSELAQLALNARWFWQTASLRVRSTLMACIGCIVLLSALSTISPILFSSFIDAVAGSGPTDFEDPLVLLALYVLIYFFSKLFGELRWILFGVVEQNYQKRQAVQVLDHILRLPLGFHLSRKSGAVQYIINRGLAGYRSILTAAIFYIVPLVFELVFVALAVLSFFSIEFLLVVSAGLSAYLATVLFSVNQLRAYQRAANDAFTRSGASCVDALINVEAIKLYTNEAFVAERYKNDLVEVEEHWNEYYRWRSVFGAVQGLIITVLIGVVTYLSLRGLRSGELTIGSVVLINAYILQLLRPLEGLAFAYRDLKRALVSVEDLREISQQKKEEEEGAVASLEIPRRDNRPLSLTFQNVCFGYDDDSNVLDDVSFHIEAGERVALLGPSGSGKSSVARLVARLYEPRGGEILVNGEELKTIHHANVRQRVGIVPQDVVMFHESLDYNVAFGDPSRDRRERENAAERAHLGKYVKGLRAGLDTVVGERGLKLSGGEKQRLAIARMLLRQSGLWILDEPTSALDPETERSIVHEVLEVSRGLTVLLITHRLDVASKADRIIVLDKGKIVEQGSHSDLLAQAGLYQQIWHADQ